jgi:hypothetical protein
VSVNHYWECIVIFKEQYNNYYIIKQSNTELEANNWAVVDILLKLNGFILNILFIMNNAKNAGNDIYNLVIINFIIVFSLLVIELIII